MLDQSCFFFIVSISSFISRAKLNHPFEVRSLAVLSIPALAFRFCNHVGRRL
jgi:hypothetical protein